MLKDQELKYIEEQIKKIILSIEHAHFQYVMGEDYEEEYTGWTNAQIRVGLKDLYFMILAYLEGRQMIYFLQTFKSIHEPLINDNEKMMKDSVIHPDGEPELDLIVSFKQFLEPFKFFDYRQAKDQEYIKLSSILRNTGFIIKSLKISVKNEADIYKQIKWIIGLCYPSVRLKNKASFIQEFKTYSPDILVPELKTAIEFKYIDKKYDNIDEFLDQVKVDATNYVDDFRYDTFYAVIYVEDISIATPESIEVSWKAKRFPPNWHLILSGHTLKSPDLESRFQ